MRIRLTTVALLVLALLVLSGCALGGGGGGEPPAKANSPSSAKIRSCLKRSRITVRTDYKVPGTPRETRGIYRPETAKYSGSAYWPNGHVVDLWTAKTQDDAASAEAELETAFNKFDKGSGDEKVIKRGDVVYALDDFETPLPKETAALDSCLTS